MLSELRLNKETIILSNHIEVPGELTLDDLSLILSSTITKIKIEHVKQSFNDNNMNIYLLYLSIF